MEEKGWSKYLSNRSRDVLDMVGEKVSRICKQPAEQTDIVAEISRGFGYVSIMNSSSPCVTPSGCVWIFNRWRWTVGLEALALQGFPVDDLDFEDLTNMDIQGLAGNSMSVPVVGAFLLLVLACVQFPDAASEEEVARASATSQASTAAGSSEASLAPTSEVLSPDVSSEGAPTNEVSSEGAPTNEVLPEGMVEHVSSDEGTSQARDDGSLVNLE